MSTAHRPRVVLNSIPKAGTYLISEIIARLGFHQTYLHLALKRVIAYDRNLLQSGRSGPSEFVAQCPIEESIHLVRTGEFAAAHLPHTPTTVQALEPIRIVLAIREFRSALLSQKRFRLQTNRFNASKSEWAHEPDPHKSMVLFMKESSKTLIEEALKICPWTNEPNVLTVRFESIKSDPEMTVQSIRSYLCDHLKDDGQLPSNQAVLQDALDSNTLTKSTGSLKLDQCWSDEAEQIFIANGGQKVNDLLGYAPSPVGC